LIRRVLLSLTLLVLLTGSVSAPLIAEDTMQLYEAITAAIRDARNDSIKTSTLLHIIAHYRADQLAKYDHLGHAGFYPAMTKFGAWRYYRLGGEIVGWHNRAGATGTWFVNAWLASDTHRPILLGRWDRVGVSCARNTTRVYCVAIFGLLR
jgi:uncharacterized protein YkwD